MRSTAPSAARSHAAIAAHAARLLLIDDDAAHLDIVQELLQPLDFDVVHRARRRQRPARWPPSSTAGSRDGRHLDARHDGLGGGQELRAMPDLQRLKIVFVSANAHEYSPGGDRLTARRLRDEARRHAAPARLPGGALLGLAWIYEPASPARPATLVQTAALPGDSRHHLDDLYQLGRIGHVRGIQAKLREIEAEDPANKPLAHALRALVANFDLKRYMNVLEAMRKAWLTQRHR